MTLNRLDLRPEYSKDSDDIAADFYLPCMAAATRYDRITGYFSSSVYVLAWPALRQFVANHGRIRVICSPILSPSDIDGLERASAAQTDGTIAAALLNELEYMLSKPQLNRASVGLACLVAVGVVDIRVAILNSEAPAPARRMFHDKAGVFLDSHGNAVGFRGSMNETFLGLSPDGNLESIDVFPSWSPGRDAERVANATSRFEHLWANEVPGVSVRPLPDRVRDVLIEAGADASWELIADELTVASHGADSERQPQRGTVGDRTLHRHQEMLLQNWLANGRRGIAEAATGAGKTTIGVAAIGECVDDGLGALVLVPSTLLLDQWVDEIQRLLPDVRLLRFGDGDRAWARPGVLRRLASPNQGEKRVAVATMQTASQPDFLGLLGPTDNLLVVADEVHRLGSAAFGRILGLDALGRLGLSATPRRYGDPAGTQALLDWFGGILEPRYSLSDALMDGVLTPYAYHPHHVELSEDEHRQWTELSAQIGRRAAILGDEGSTDEALKRLLIRRARIAKGASAKPTLAARILSEEFRPGQRWLVYCDTQPQVDQVRSALAGSGIGSVEYHSAMAGNRRVALADFEVNGGVVVAIRCLDEGVDLPAVTHALVLASSRNPREFIQRRGRVLRRHPNKRLAHVHDALISPPVAHDMTDRLILAELGRAVEFAKGASNPDCRVDLETLCARCGIDPTTVRDLGDEEEDDTDGN